MTQTTITDGDMKALEARLDALALDVADGRAGAASELAATRKRLDAVQRQHAADADTAARAARERERRETAAAEEGERVRVARLRDRLATLHVQRLEAARKIEAATDVLLIALDEATRIGREMYRTSGRGRAARSRTARRGRGRRDRAPAKASLETGFLFDQTVGTVPRR
jgi:hypothetical protein